MKPSEVISEARNILFERGWTQGTYENDAGELCTLGALNAVYQLKERAPDVHLGAAIMSARVAVQESIGHKRIPTWNDHRDRTFSDVIDALDKAEKIAEQQEAADQ